MDLKIIKKCLGDIQCDHPAREPSYCAVEHGRGRKVGRSTMAFGSRSHFVQGDTTNVYLSSRFCCWSVLSYHHINY